MANIKGFEPHLVILAGIAGSLKHDLVQIGDVVISDRVKYIQPDKIREIGSRERFSLNPEKDHAADRLIDAEAATLFVDEDKRFLKESFFRFRRDAIVWHPSSNLFQDLKLEAKHIDFGLSINFDGEKKEPFPTLDTRSPRVHFGAVLGSEWVIDSSEFISFLEKRDRSRASDLYTQKYGLEDNERSEWVEDELLSVDTESYGFFRGLRDVQGGANGSQALVVRGISDLAAAKEEHDDLTGGFARKIAARNSVRAALAIIDRL